MQKERVNIRWGEKRSWKGLGHLLCQCCLHDRRTSVADEVLPGLHFINFMHFYFILVDF